MNCEQARHDILLGESGELAPERLALLDQHVVACDACRAYRDESLALMGALKPCLQQGKPSPAVLAAIRAVAAQRAPRPAVPYTPWLAAIVTHRRLAVEIMAWAAVALLLVGGWFMVPEDTALQPAAAPMPAASHSQALQVSALIDLASQEEETFSHAVSGDVDEHQQLQALARQLLEMEGLDGSEFVEPDETTSPAEPDSTGLPGHSTAALAAGRCV